MGWEVSRRAGDRTGNARRGPRACGRKVQRGQGGREGTQRAGARVTCPCQEVSEGRATVLNFPAPSVGPRGWCAWDTQPTSARNVTCSLSPKAENQLSAQPPSSRRERLDFCFVFCPFQLKPHGSKPHSSAKQDPEGEQAARKGDQQITNHREPFDKALLVRLKGRQCFF